MSWLDGPNRPENADELLDRCLRNGGNVRDEPVEIVSRPFGFNSDKARLIRMDDSAVARHSLVPPERLQIAAVSVSVCAARRNTPTVYETRYSAHLV